jgi:CheY-like chemotaxis protein
MKRILCIDDDKIAGMIAKITLSRYPEIQIDIQHDAAQAFENLRAEIQKKDPERLLPQYILLDLNMPVMDGWEFLDAYQQEVFKAEPGIKIMILSSSMDPADKRKALEYPFVSHFLPKPIHESILSLIGKEI